MAQIWFIKSTYNGNTFKVSEFFNADGTYKKNAGSNLEVDMPFNDGFSLVDAIHHQTVNGTHIRDYTHFIVPDKNKVYRINKIDELNHDTLRMEVEDQPWIAQYNQYKNVNMNITRSNDFVTYLGYNDIKDLNTNYETTITNLKNTKTRSNLWQLVYVKSLTEEQMKVTKAIGFSVKTNRTVNPLEIYSSLSDAKLKYPDKTFSTAAEMNQFAKESLQFNKIIQISGVIYEYNAVDEKNIKLIEQKKLRWSNSSEVGKLYLGISQGNDSVREQFYNSKISTFPDVDSYILALPLSVVMEATVGLPAELSLNPILSSYYLENIFRVSGDVDSSGNITNPSELAMEILGIKIVPEDLLFKEGIQITSNKNTNLELQHGGPMWAIPLRDRLNSNNYRSKVYVLRNTESNIDLNYTKTLTNITQVEPFTKYDLIVSGQSIEIASFRLGNLTMKSSVNSMGINYNIYLDKELTKLISSGSISNNGRWSTDSYQEWAASNPTYKEEYLARKQMDWANNLTSAGTGIIGGTAAGFVMGGPGGALAGFGAGVSNAITSAIGTNVKHKHQDKLFELEDKARKLTSDQIMGDPNAGGLITLIRQSIYMIEKKGNRVHEMLREYYKVGHPTQKYTKIDSLKWQNSNEIYPRNKVVSGYLETTIVNNYTTDLINLKLSDGIVIIE